MSSVNELEKMIKLIKAKLNYTNNYFMIDIFYVEVEKDSYNLFIGLTESLTNTKKIQGMSFISLISFPNIPIYSVSTGFLFDLKKQAIGLNIGLTEPFFLYFSVGHTFLKMETNALISIDGFQYKILPELTFDFLTVYNYIFKEIPENKNNDLSLKSSLSLDYSYLKNVNLFGYRFSTDITQGIGQYNYTVQTNDIRLYLLLFDFMETAIRTRLSFFRGNTPFYLMPDKQLENYFRAPLSNQSGTKSISLNIEQKLLDLFTLDIFICSLKPGIILFSDIGQIFQNYNEIQMDSLNIAFGGGIKLDFGFPISIAFRIEYGYNPIIKDGELIIGLGDYF